MESGPFGVLMQSLLAVPFFGAAWLARRLPRVAGVMLLLFVGPLLVAGLGLLRREIDAN